MALDSRSALTIASENGYDDIVTLLIERPNTNVNINDLITHRDHSCNALSWAAWNGHENVVRLLLSRKDLEPQRIDSPWAEMPLYISGDLPLHHAVIRGHMPIVRLLLDDKRVDVNSKSRKSYTALHVACRVGRADFVQLLLSYGADISSIDIDNDTARDCAIDNGHDDIVKILDEATLQSLGPLDTAAWLGDQTDLEKLVENGCASQKELSQAALYACERGHMEAVKLLLDHLGNEHAAIIANQLLWLASWHGDKVMVQLLLKRPGVDINSKNPNGRTGLSLAAHKGHTAIVHIFLSEPAIDVNTQDKNEDTPLIWAAYYGHTDAVAEILAHPDTDPNIRNNYRDVALNYAVRYGHAEAVGLLLGAPDIDVNTSSLQSNAPIHETALHAAGFDAAVQHAGSNRCLELLLARPDLNVNVRRDTGDTVLSIAAERGFDDQVAILLSRKDLDRNPVNKKNETPYSIARWWGYDKITSLLEDARAD